MANNSAADVQGSDNRTPLSLQWLLPKPAENKPAVGTGTQETLRRCMARRKRMFFGLPLLDTETYRRYHWRDEERDTNSSVRKDHWRDGDKELGDSWRIDHWMENSSTKHYEARRAPSERWAD